MKKIIVVSMLSLLVGCAGGSDPGGTQRRAGALNPGGFGTWTVIPGGSNFVRRPALTSSYSSPTSREWDVCGTTLSNTILCTNRYIIGGRDSGWSAWTAVAPPSGYTFGASNPTMTSWTDYNGNTWDALAARVNGSSCQNCIYIQVGQHGSPNTWYQVRLSSVHDTFANTDDISLVSSGGYLYLVGVGGSGPYLAYLAQNNVQYGFSNANWTWTTIPGGGIFNKPVMAAPLTEGGLIVVGIGTDNAAYGQELLFGNWDGYWWGAGGGYFNDSPSGTSFDPEGQDLEVFGLGGNNAEWQGNLYDWNSFDGWYQFGNASFLSSPVAFQPPGTSHIDLAARGNTWSIYVNEFNGSPNP